VSIFKKFRHKAQTAGGELKKRAGRLSGNRRLETEGRAGQVAGAARQAADKVKNAFRR
jgi:uncharacterized protein YjbJ (UPF0337 family)